MAKTPATSALDAFLVEFDPIIREQGFRKDARTYRHTTPEGLVHVINFQMSSYGTAEEGRFAVNLEVFIPEVCAHFRPDEDIKKVSIVDCTVRERLAMLDDAQIDVWWSTANPDTNLEDLNSRFWTNGFPYLSNFASRTD